MHDTSQHLSLKLLLFVILCVLFARNSAMGFNRYADREIDKKNPRTALRELPRNIIKPRSALWFVIINASLFILTTFFINKLCFSLSPLALFVILGYSLTKRYTYLSHLILGLGLSLAPVGAYLAVAGYFNILPVIYSLVVIFWVAAFDIIYSLQDEEFDKTEKLKSIPVILGKENALIVSAFFHLISVTFVVIAGWIGAFHLLYWIGTGIFAAIMVYEHMIVKPADLSHVNLAFATLNGLASVIFALFVISDIIFL